MAIEILSDEIIIGLIIASSKELLKNPHFTDCSASKMVVGHF